MARCWVSIRGWGSWRNPLPPFLNSVFRGVTHRLTLKGVGFCLVALNLVSSL